VYATKLLFIPFVCKFFLVEVRNWARGFEIFRFFLMRRNNVFFCPCDDEFSYMLNKTQRVYLPRPIHFFLFEEMILVFLYSLARFFVRTVWTELRATNGRRPLGWRLKISNNCTIPRADRDYWRRGEARCPRRMDLGRDCALDIFFDRIYYGNASRRRMRKK